MTPQKSKLIFNFATTPDSDDAQYARKEMERLSQYLVSKLEDQASLFVSNPSTDFSRQLEVLNAKLSKFEPVIQTGLTSQYYRGDKSWQFLNKAAVGLGLVENTALSTWAGSANITTLGTLTGLNIAQTGLNAAASVSTITSGSPSFRLRDGSTVKGQWEWDRTSGNTNFRDASGIVFYTDSSRDLSASVGFRWGEGERYRLGWETVVFSGVTDHISKWEYGDKANATTPEAYLSLQFESKYFNGSNTSSEYHFNWGNPSRTKILRPFECNVQYGDGGYSEGYTIWTFGVDQFIVSGDSADTFAQRMMFTAPSFEPDLLIRSLNASKDSRSRIMKYGGSEWMQFASGNGGSYAENNTFSIDNVASGAGTIYPLKFRKSINGGSTFSDFLVLDYSNMNAVLSGTVQMSALGLGIAADTANPLKALISTAATSRFDFQNSSSANGARAGAIFRSDTAQLVLDIYSSGTAGTVAGITGSNLIDFRAITSDALLIRTSAAPIILAPSGVEQMRLPVAGGLQVTNGFGCNGKTPQAAVASGGTLAGVIAALVADGILSS